MFINHSLGIQSNPLRLSRCLIPFRSLLLAISLIPASFVLAQTDTSSNKLASGSSVASNTEADMWSVKPSDLAKSSWSGIFPGLASFNGQGECGTGAVVPWADRLWWVTYAPHQPQGSDDKLYSIDTHGNLQVYEGSIGGTPANRMIHNESQQLFIGPYVIDSKGTVRVIPYNKMYGRPTGNARHLFDPANKIYLATMEEGFYEIDVKSLEVNELWRDEQQKGGRHADLPGYHGKGFYSGQGRVIYANNGEHGNDALSKPDIPSGVLATWDGKATKWEVIKRNQFTEVTGPNGIFGGKDPENDPIWSVGWDHRSLILTILEKGVWHTYRLPKASHAYDGAHGWNTEWPRIREIGENDLLMTMHGMFWRFPKSFSTKNSAGITPRSTYMKIVGDFCRWQNKVVLGCDDAAKAEFLNTRRAKGKLAGPAQSQSNLCFLEPEQLDSFGAPVGRGAVWLQDAVVANSPSDPFLFSGFSQRSIHLVHDQAGKEVEFTFESDIEGNGNWTTLKTVKVPGSGYVHVVFNREEKAVWVRLKTNVDCKATAWFEMRSDSNRHPPHDLLTATDKASGKNNSLSKFAGLLLADQVASRLSSNQPGSSSGSPLLLAGDRASGLKLLPTQFTSLEATPDSYFQLKPDFQWVRTESKTNDLAKNVAVPKDILSVDGNSILYVDDDGKRYRLPIGNPIYRSNPKLLSLQRVSREVTTERDLFQAAGVFYELPARNAGGFAKIRPISTHPYFIQDYCSWRGMLVLSGVDPQAVFTSLGSTKEQASDGNKQATCSAINDHIVVSKEHSVGVWLGSIDDLWSMGKPKGRGGPWLESAVKKNEWSDPYLMTGYDFKSIRLSHKTNQNVTVRAQVDITGSGMWVDYQEWQVPPGKDYTYTFPSGFEAYWIRLSTDTDATATAELDYQ